MKGPPYALGPVGFGITQGAAVVAECPGLKRPMGTVVNTHPTKGFKVYWSWSETTNWYTANELRLNLLERTGYAAGITALSVRKFPTVPLGMTYLHVSNICGTVVASLFVSGSGSKVDWRGSSSLPELTKLAKVEGDRNPYALAMILAQGYGDPPPETVETEPYAVLSFETEQDYRDALATFNVTSEILRETPGGHGFFMDNLQRYLTTLRDVATSTEPQDG